MLGCYFNPKQDQKFEINESLILSGILFYLKAKLSILQNNHNSSDFDCKKSTITELISKP